MNTLHYLIHSTAYYIAWFACIKLAALGYPWLSSFTVLCCVSLQIYWQSRTQQGLRGLWLLLTIILAVSTIVDSALVHQSILIFSANPFLPYFTSPWMMSLWISFTVVLYATLNRLFDHLLVLGLLSFLGFAFAFYIGEKLSAVDFPYGNITTIYIGAIWSILIPICIYSYKKIGVKLSCI